MLIDKLFKFVEALKISNQHGIIYSANVYCIINVLLLILNLCMYVYADGIWVLCHDEAEPVLN